jgi:hypothetical protein
MKLGRKHGLTRIVPISIIIVVFLGAVVVYLFVSTPRTHPPIPSKSNLVVCLVQYYTVWSVAYIRSNSTSYGTSTQSSNTTVTTTTDVSETIGYATSTQMNFTGTLTGAIAEWTESACTYTVTK